VKKGNDKPSPRATRPIDGRSSTSGSSTADRDVDRRRFYFDDVRLRHRALPEIDLDDVDTSTTFMGKKLRAPLLISCMTGGDHDLVRRINRNLAEAAEACGVALGVGSQRVMFTHPKARASFALRAFAPPTLLFANLGAVQLNRGFTVAECREAVDVLEADGLYLHLNPLQEAVQPEGDTQFGGLADQIGQVVRDLHQAGDPEGSGRRHLGGGRAAGAAAGHPLHRRGRKRRHLVEPHRAPSPGGRASGRPGPAVPGLGHPTPRALWELRACRKGAHPDRLRRRALGLDMAKAIVLGASLCGVAAPFLEPALTSAGRWWRSSNACGANADRHVPAGGGPGGRLWGNDALLLDPVREAF
jgi:isopentenyl-diphosphate delta-isomerase